MEDRGLVEVGEIGHVLTFLELGRVHLSGRVSVGKGQKRRAAPAGSGLS